MLLSDERSSSRRRPSRFWCDEELPFQYAKRSSPHQPPGHAPALWADLGPLVSLHLLDARCHLRKRDTTRSRLSKENQHQRHSTGTRVESRTSLCFGTFILISGWASVVLIIAAVSVTACYVAILAVTIGAVRVFFERIPPASSSSFLCASSPPAALLSKNTENKFNRTSPGRTLKTRVVRLQKLNSDT